jgi:hypothetical protein
MTRVSPHQPVPDRTPTIRGWPAPWLFGVLILPQGIYLGFVTTVLPFLFGKASVPIDRIARTTSLLSLPWIVCFLWSPLVDVWLRRRTWLVIWALATALCLGVSLPLVNAANLNLVTLLALAGAISASLMLAACGGLIVTVLAATAQPKGAAWYEAGKLAGSALGAALLLWLGEHLPRVFLGAVSCLVTAAPALAGFTIWEEKPRNPARFKTRITEIRNQLRGLARDPAKRWGLFLIASPVGTGAALTLFPALAHSYGVGTSGVIWTNGVGGGGILALGSLCGALMPGNWNRGWAYVVAGVTNALAALTLLAGNRPLVYFVGVILYFATTGLCWARFAALVVEIVGSTSRDASTRFTIVTALGTLPLAYMATLDGIGATRFGIYGLLWTDASGNFLMAVVAVAACILGRRGAGGPLLDDDSPEKTP